MRSKRFSALSVVSSPQYKESLLGQYSVKYLFTQSAKFESPEPSPNVDGDLCVTIICRSLLVVFIRPSEDSFSHFLFIARH